MDMNNLFTEQGMRDATGEQRDTWVNDAVQIRQIAQIIQARVANTQIDGDSTGSASRRARKVARPWQQAARLLEKAAARMEAADALYQREVLELPDRRVKALERKEMRRHRLGIAAGGAQEAIASSLQQSTAALNGTAQVGNPQVTPASPQPQFVSPQFTFPTPTGTDQIPSIGDLFGKQEAV